MRAALLLLLALAVSACASVPTYARPGYVPCGCILDEDE